MLQVMGRLINWEPKLAKKMSSLPTDKNEFAELVFAQPDYKNRSQRDKESKEKKDKADKK